MPEIRRRVAGNTAVLVLGLSLAGCTIGDASNAPGDDEKQVNAAASEQEFAPPEISVDDDQTSVEPLDPITVTAEAGIRAVQMTNESGTVVQGEFDDDMKAWRTAEPLGYGRTYTLTGSDRNGTTFERSFTTVVPNAQTSTYLGPGDGAEVGVGQAVTIRFSYPPGDQQAAEDAIEIETSNDTEGGFYWLSSTELIWRPKDYWEPGTEVSVKADIYGRDLGDGVYGAAANEINFSIGDEVVTTVDNATKRMVVTRNGETIKEIPVSLGRQGQWETPNGIYVVGDRNPTMMMDSETFGLSLDAGGYRTQVKYATQLSYSGIYVHAAPWAAGALGQYNQSHGCINVSTEDAQWFQNEVKPGDPVEVVNTGGSELAGTDGLGYWNIDWDELDGNSTEGE